MPSDVTQHVSPETMHAFKNGYILVYDIKDGMDLRQDAVVEESPDAFDVCRDALFQDYIQQEADDPPQGRALVEVETQEELEQGFQETAIEYMFFRVSSDYQESTVEEILTLCRERSFWLPMFVFKKGQQVEMPSQGMTLL